MIIQQKDRWGRWQVFGFGRVFCKKDTKPVTYARLKDSAKASFEIMVGVKKNPEGSNVKYEYNVLPCAIYGKQHNKEMFALCKKLGRDDKVFFGGLYYNKKAQTPTGEILDFSEVRLEFLEPFDIRIVKSWLKMMNRSQDDKDFDNEKEEEIADLRNPLDYQMAVDAAKVENSDDYDF